MMGLCDSGAATSSSSEKRGSACMQRLIGILNAISVVFFPALLIVFEIAYWSFYQSVSDDVVDDLICLHPDC